MRRRWCSEVLTARDGCPAVEYAIGEVVLDRLLGKLMEICLATAGAERGALALVEQDGRLMVRAVGSIR